MDLKTLLRERRQQHRMSQLELSMRLGVSQRHVSFVESGRANPSRDLLIHWLQEIHAPLPTRNAALAMAGYANVYSEQPLQTQALTPARLALERLIERHDPLPAVVLDSAWNVLQHNQGMLWLMQAVLPPHTLQEALAEPQVPLNLVSLLCHPQGLTSRMRNLHEAGPALLAQLREDATHNPALVAYVEQFEALVASRLGKAALRSVPAQLPPVLSTSFETQYGVLSLFSIVSTFGTPQNITLASLRVEHLFPADQQTERVLREHAGINA